MIRRVIIFFVLISTVFTTSFNTYRYINDDSSVDNSTDSPALKPEYLKVNSDWVDSVLKSLTVDEKIAQLMMIAAYSNRDKTHVDHIVSLIEQYNIGGLIFFQGGPVRQAIQTNIYQAHAKTPLFIAMDAEWGLKMRIDSTMKYPFQMMLGAVEDNELIYTMGTHLAEQMHRLGVHINFAPVVDINNNPDNPVINIRSFGENKENVLRKATAYMMGMQDNRIITTIKHFPGHGDTDSDSHHTLPVIKHDLNRLQEFEMYPFQKMIKGGATGVMVAHLNIPAMDSTPDLPSTLSPKIVKGWLKDELGFEGLIFTDALNMKGASNFFKPGDIEVNAFKAGNDILLMPDNVPLAIRSIRKEVEAGNILIEDINQRVKKILAAKYWAGLDHPQKLDINSLSTDLNKPEYMLLRKKLAASAITVLNNRDRILPLENLDTLKIASVALGENAKNEFQRTLDLYTKVDHFQAPKDILISDYKKIMQTLKEYNLVILSVSNTDIRVTKDYGISLKNISLADSIIEKQNTLLVHFANPYALNFFNNLEKTVGLVVGYQDEDYIQNLAAQSIFGGITVSGKLPVSINLFQEGTGIETFGRSRLSYGTLHEASINPLLELLIDSIAENAIVEKASPGCQVLVARNGIVCFNKAYGFHTYQKKKQVDIFDVYDLASITKILATMPLVMKLEEENVISLKDNLGEHVPYYDTTNKGPLKLGEVLTHQAGLKAWIPFYLSTLETLTPDIELFSKSIDDDHPYKLARRSYMTKHLIYVDSVYRQIQTSAYPVKVAENMFMNAAYIDTIRYKIGTSELENPHEYKYSDLGFYILQDLIELKFDSPLEEITSSQLYGPLGANNTCFIPLTCFGQHKIVPTENDIFFRRQLLQGYVHDYGAAMMGGVSGHAGLFSNANDVAKIMQMYLNEGEYGGKQFLKSSTIKQFTSQPYSKDGNRRAYGFDKPKLPKHDIGPTCDLVSEKSYGHTGFTGTIAWVDPEYNLIYVFLSNRIHPDANNSKLLTMDVRTKIQEAIYQNLK